MYPWESAALASRSAPLMETKSAARSGPVSGRRPGRMADSTFRGHND